MGLGEIGLELDALVAVPHRQVKRHQLDVRGSTVAVQLGIGLKKKKWTGKERNKRGK